MSNPISSIFSGSPSLDKASLDKTKRKALERPLDGQSDSAKAPSAAAAPKDDQLVLSEVAQRAMADALLRAAKAKGITLT